MSYSSILNALKKPPLYANMDEYAWKKWLDDIYTEYVKSTNPASIISTDNQILGLDFLYLVDATSGALTVNLPAANQTKGKKYVIKKIDSSSNSVTVTPESVDTIDGSSTNVLSAQWDAIFIESDGQDHWYILANGGGGGGGSVTSVSAGDETIIIGGTSTDPTVRSNSTDVLITSVDLVPGKFVNVYNDAGTPKLRLADSSLGQGYQADGFVVDTVSANNPAKIYTTGMNTHVSGMTAGEVFLSTGGDASNTAPTTAGYISQCIGIATSATEIAFEPEIDILLEETHATGSGGLILKDEGVTLGDILTLDFVGNTVTATRSGTDGTVTITGGQSQTLYVYFP